MKRVFWLLLAVLLSQSASFAQTAVAQTGAEQTIQPSQTSRATSLAPGAGLELKIPAGTPIEVEVAYTVSSLDIRPGELLSFRVLIPVIVDGVTAIEEGALVTARVTLAKRGGHWGKAGRLAWAMEDVVAADNTRILLDPATQSRNEALWNLESKGKDSKATQLGQGSVKGTSHKGEVATKTIIAAAIFPPLAPLALMHGFRRGENAVLPEGKRFVVVVRSEASVSVTQKN